MISRAPKARALLRYAAVVGYSALDRMPSTLFVRLAFPSSIDQRAHSPDQSFRAERLGDVRRVQQRPGNAGLAVSGDDEEGGPGLAKRACNRLRAAAAQICIEDCRVELPSLDQSDRFGHRCRNAAYREAGACKNRFNPLRNQGFVFDYQNVRDHVRWLPSGSSDAPSSTELAGVLIRHWMPSGR
jgi:hypothetical protein